METNDIKTGVMRRKELPCDHCGEGTIHRCSGGLDPQVAQHPCCSACAERDNDCPYRKLPKPTNGGKYGQVPSVPDVALKAAVTAKTNCFTCGGNPCACFYTSTRVPTPPASTAIGFVKADNGKLQLDLVPPHFIEGVGQALHFGAVTKGYGRGNYLKGAEWHRYIGAVMRHLNDWRKGEENDQESGINHLYHAAACLVILTESIRLKIGKDDRKEVTG